MVAASAPLGAQTGGVFVSARTGLATANANYQANCGHMSVALSLDVQGRRQVFPQISVDHFSGSGGGDKLCFAVAPTLGTAVGGLRLEGATRVGLGIGGRLGSGLVQLEGVALGGVVAGRRGHAPRDDQSRHVMPHVGGRASLVLLRFVVFSAATNWTRLSLDVTPIGGGTSRTQTSWSPMGTLQFGVRVPIGR